MLRHADAELAPRARRPLVHVRVSAIRQAFQRAVNENVFPGAVALVRSRGTVVFHEAVGTGGVPPDDQPVHLESIYDLASLTKPLATSTALLCLVQDGHLHLDQPVSQWVDELRGSLFAGAGLRQLLSHQAGLPAWRPYYEQLAPSGLPPRNEEERRQRVHALLNAIASEPIEYQPGSQSLYSDLGFMVLGEIVERCAGASLAAYCRRRIYEPLGISSLAFLGCGETITEDPTRIVPTERERWRNRLLRGEVHDENAYALGGCAGHAGLFGTAHAVGQLSAAWLQAVQGREGVLSPALAKQFTHRQSDTSSWGLGWDTPSPPSSSGTRFSSRAFGHVGFTGTSLWIDPSCDLEVMIVSNRVHPTRANPAIKAFRPQIHDAIYQEWGGK